MKCKEIIEVLEQKWPSGYALSWDNVGLLVGSREKEVHRILVTLDLNDEVLQQAIAVKADMIVSHHPLIFSAVKQVTDEHIVGRRIISLIQHDIAYYAMHTNFDVKGMGQLNAHSLQLQDDAVLMVTTAEGEAAEGIGRVGMLTKPQSLAQFAAFVKEQLGISEVRIYGEQDRQIQRVAISGGSGKGMTQYARQSGADVLVTGDIDYHTGIDAVAEGLAVIDAGHYGTEYIFIEYVGTQLGRLLPELEVIEAKTVMPFWVV